MKQFVSVSRIADRTEDGLGEYLNNIRDFQTLTAPEECALADEYHRTGSKSALEKLVNANLRFVVTVAKSYTGNGLPLADLIEEGNLGLISAAKTFNGGMGFKFISYATRCIEQHLVRAIQNLGTTIRHPQELEKLIVRINRFKNSFIVKNGYEPDVIDIADGLGESDETIERALLCSMDYCDSIDTPVGEEDDNFKRDILLGDLSADGLLLKEENSNVVMDYVKQLCPQQQEIVIKYFGLGGAEPMHMPAIAIEMGKTSQRIQQLLKLAIDELRRLMREDAKYRFAA